MPSIAPMEIRKGFLLTFKIIVLKHNALPSEGTASMITKPALLIGLLQFKYIPSHI